MVRRASAPLRALRYSSPLAIASNLAFERFDGVLQVFDQLAHDTDCRRLIFDLDGNLAAHKVDSAKTGPILDGASNAVGKIDH